MRAITGSREVKLLIGDITQENADAIVNAANSQLAAGAGVDGAIRAKAGPSVSQQLAQEYPDGCPTGSAVITAAGQLPARNVIHAVGPIWRDGESEEERLLRSAYQNVLQIASDRGLRSVAFPAISAGIYGYPMPEAAIVALQAVRDFQSDGGLPVEVRFVLFEQEIYDHFERSMREIDGYTIAS